MSGSFGTSDNEDGGVASTTSSSHSGLFARNDSRDKAPAGPGGNGVFGLSFVPNASGVFGANNNGGTGVAGTSELGDGVVASTQSSAKSGIFARNDSRDNAPAGPGGNGVFGVSSVPNASGVFGQHNNGGNGIAGVSKGTGVYAKGDKFAGYFDGNVEVTRDLVVHGDIRLSGGDLAEDFDLESALQIEPGTVVTIGEGGVVGPCGAAYDRRVVGVIAGAEQFRPGIVMDQRPGVPGRGPVAMMGKVFCKADASFGPIEAGDLLTTSPTSGHAMRVTEPDRAFGAVIGKALASLPAGCGFVPIVVALQ